MSQSFRLLAILRVSRLKSPVTYISVTLLSNARLIESSMQGIICAVEIDGL